MIMDTSSKKTYLVGCYQDNEFWCRGEFSNKEQAESAYFDCLQKQPEKHIALVEQVKLHSVLVERLPKT